MATQVDDDEDQLTDEERKRQQQPPPKPTPVGPPIGATLPQTPPGVPVGGGQTSPVGTPISNTTTGSAPAQAPAMPQQAPPALPSVGTPINVPAPRPQGEALTAGMAPGGKMAPPSYTLAKTDPNYQHKPWLHALDTIAGATKIGQAAESVGGFGTIGHQANLERGEERAGAEEKQIEAGQKERQAAASTELEGARTAEQNALAQSHNNPQMRPGITPDEITLRDLMTGDNGQARVNPDTQKPYTYLEAEAAIEKTKQNAKPTPGETSEQNKLTFQQGATKLAAEGLSTDPKDLASSIDKSKTLTPQEKAAMHGYMATNPNPATNLRVNLEGAGGRQDIKNANGYYTYQDQNGETQLVQGNQLPPGVQAEPIKDPKTFIDAAHASNVVQQSLNRLSQDVDTDPEIFDDPVARGILATATEEGAARNVGILVAGTGGSISMPAGVNKIIDTLLENNGVSDPKERQALQRYIVDYWSAKDKLFALQMQMQGGKIGRASTALFNAMLNQLPGGGTASSYMAKRQMGSLQQMHTELSGQFPERYGGYTKEKPYQGGGQGGDTTKMYRGGKEYNIPKGQEQDFINDGGSTTQQ